MFTKYVILETQLCRNNYDFCLILLYKLEEERTEIKGEELT